MKSSPFVSPNLTVVVHECGHGFQSQTLEQSLCSDSSRACLDDGNDLNVLLLLESLDGPQSLSIPNQRYTRRIMFYRAVDVDSSKLAVRGKSEKKSEGSRKEFGRNSEGSELKRGGLACLALSVSRILEFVGEVTRTNYPLAREITRANHPISREITRTDHPISRDCHALSIPFLRKSPALIVPFLGKSPVVLITRFLGKYFFLEQLLFLECTSQRLVATGEST